MAENDPTLETFIAIEADNWAKEFAFRLVRQFITETNERIKSFRLELGLPRHAYGGEPSEYVAAIKDLLLRAVHHQSCAEAPPCLEILVKKRLYREAAARLVRPVVLSSSPFDPAPCSIRDERNLTMPNPMMPAPPMPVDSGMESNSMMPNAPSPAPATLMPAPVLASTVAEMAQRAMPNGLPADPGARREGIMRFIQMVNALDQVQPPAPPQQAPPQAPPPRGL